MKKFYKPTVSEIINIRQIVQIKLKSSMTKARRECATLVMRSLRTWEQWERGQRKMPAQTWNLIKLKIENYIKNC